MAESKINIRALFDLKAFSTSSQNLQRQMKQTAKQMQNIGMQMSTALTLPLVGLAGLAVKSAADFESLKTSLQTSLGGSAEAAKKAFSDIEKFASSTPFALEEVTSGFIKLKNMGLDPSMAALESYGNTASSMGKSLNDMVEAVADAAVGEFERLKEFGIKAKSEGDRVTFTFKGVATEIGKNSKEIEQYLQNIGNTEFAGGIEAQSKTFNGVMSTLKDNMALAAASFGELMLPALKKLSSALQKAAEFVRQLNPETKNLIIQMGLFAAAIGPAIFALGKLLSVMAFLVANPAIAALVAIGAALAVINIAAAQSNKLFATTQSTIDNMTDAYVKLSEQLDIINGLKESGRKLSKEEIQTTIAATKAIIKQTEAIIAQSVARYEALIRQLENQMQATLSQTRGVGMQGEFIGADLAKIDGIKKNIAALSDTINEANGKLIETQTAFNSLEKDLKSIKDVVIETTDKTDKGFKELSEGVKSSMESIDHSLRSVGIGIDFSKTFERLEIAAIEAKNVAVTAANEISHVYQAIGQSLNEGLEKLVIESAVLMGEFIGNIMSGQDLTGLDFGKSILNAIGGFMADFGKAMIAIGVSTMALDLAISTGNAALAIGAGIALVAAGTALSNVSKKGIDYSGEGGGAGGYSSPSRGSSMNGYDLQPIVLETKIQGRELILVQDRSRQFRR
tara:strand:- start:591 stop:2633 length:2043 start_codon:yes stop_codon:yes gene_type:complete